MIVMVTKITIWLGNGRGLVVKKPIMTFGRKQEMKSDALLTHSITWPLCLCSHYFLLCSRQTRIQPLEGFVTWKQKTTVWWSEKPIDPIQKHKCIVCGYWHIVHMHTSMFIYAHKHVHFLRFNWGMFAVIYVDAVIARRLLCVSLSLHAQKHVRMR